MHKQTLVLTPDKFMDIYSDEAFRNEVAGAHQCCDSLGHFKHWQTCSYPITYIVDEEQIKAAKEEKLRRKKEVKDLYQGKLVLVGMGSTYEPRFSGDVCNFRVRGEFQNPAGRRFFVEFTGGHGEGVHIPHAIDRTAQDEHQDNINKQHLFYNYQGLERKQFSHYSHQTLLHVVNTHFDCHFTELVVDNHNLSTDDMVSRSPAPPTPMDPPEKLARAFAAIIREWLTPEELQAVIESNARPENAEFCATHEYCDPNVAMSAAFYEVAGHPLRFGVLPGGDMALVNAAWDLAKQNHFYHKTSASCKS
jgi:hypothetical protein